MAVARVPAEGEFDEGLAIGRGLDGPNDDMRVHAVRARFLVSFVVLGLVIVNQLIFLTVIDAAEPGSIWTDIA
ncbi:hypothetical protein FRZ44_38950 [Hypericibacter terrae]|uniref:Uncharacterized protein n=1 Tax=Hypericibacter terrae TaxID=2602015 RepID=A0A5J6MLZ2_9PROT|nr:hypothetical protein FRZ44_38950 [Hypericibacter terrae]